MLLSGRIIVCDLSADFRNIQKNLHRDVSKSCSRVLQETGDCPSLEGLKLPSLEDNMATEDRHERAPMQWHLPLQLSLRVGLKDLQQQGAEDRMPGKDEVDGCKGRQLLRG